MNAFDKIPCQGIIWEIAFQSLTHSALRTLLCSGLRGTSMERIRDSYRKKGFLNIGKNQHFKLKSGFFLTILWRQEFLIITHFPLESKPFKKNTKLWRCGKVIQDTISTHAPPLKRPRTLSQFFWWVVGGSKMFLITLRGFLNRNWFSTNKSLPIALSLQSDFGASNSYGYTATWSPFYFWFKSLKKSVEKHVPSNLWNVLRCSSSFLLCANIYGYKDAKSIVVVDPLSTPKFVVR